MEHDKTGFSYLRHHRHSMTVCLAWDGANNPLARTRDSALPPLQLRKRKAEGVTRHVYPLWSGTSHHTTSLFLSFMKYYRVSWKFANTRRRETVLKFVREKVYNIYSNFNRCSHTLEVTHVK